MPSGRSQVNEFVIEAREQLASVCDALLTLERASPTDARERIAQLLRAVHTVKGGAGFVGFRQMERLAHAMESALERLQESAASMAGAPIDALLAATDQIAAMLDHLEGSNECDIESLLERLAQLARPTASAAVAGEAAAEPRPLPDMPASSTEEAQLLVGEADSRPEVEVSTHEHRYRVQVNLTQCHRRNGELPVDIIARLAQCGRLSEGHLELQPETLDSSLANTEVLWTTLVVSRQPPEVFTAAHGISELTWTLADRAAPEGLVAPASADVQPAAGVPWTLSTGAIAGSDRATTIRIPVPLIDRLMTLAGELVLVRNQTRRSAEVREPLPGATVQRLQSVTTELQEAVLQTRMQPVGTLFGKFPRLVRDVARQLGKEIDLELIGTDVELDKTILDAISDPLMHLVRNACDHGLETGEERIHAGKSRAGRVVLAAEQSGDEITILIRDDGRGIDRERVKRRALQQGTRHADELARLPDDEILRLILLPGFSTAAEVSDLSGRGVGMDVVKTNLDQVGGSVQIESTVGVGTTMRLRLPLTLAIIPSLLVNCGGQTFAIPQKDLEQLLQVRPRDVRMCLERTVDWEFVRRRDELLPVVRLSEILRHPEPFTESIRRRIVQDAAAAEPAPLLCAVVRAGDRRFALVIDSVLSSEEIVVKPMHAALRRLGIYTGATILGDGQVVLILQAEGLARHAGVRPTVAPSAVSGARCAAESLAIPLLVFDCGGAEQFAVPLGMMRRIVLINPAECEAVGHQRFAVLDGIATRLVDLHDQFELSAPTESGPDSLLLIPRTSHDPAGLLARQILETCEAVVTTDRKVLEGPGVLGVALVQGKLTTVLDLQRVLARVTDDQAVAPPGAPSSRHILLVDDTAMFREIIRSHLASWGFQVTTANDGAQALQQLERNSFDLVISDLEMPILDGWELARRARRLPGREHLPMLALSTLSNEVARQRALTAGFDAYQVKLDPGALQAALDDLLTLRRRLPTAGGMPT